MTLNITEYRGALTLTLALPQSERLPNSTRSLHKKLRDAICDFAGDTPKGNEWAHHRYQQLRADGKSHPHAERILARTWAHIIWRCWQDRVPYDPARHGAFQRLQHSTSLT